MTSGKMWGIGTADKSVAQESGFQFPLSFRALAPISLPDLGGHFPPWNSQALPRSGDQVRGRGFYQFVLKTRPTHTCKERAGQGKAVEGL